MKAKLNGSTILVPRTDASGYVSLSFEQVRAAAELLREHLTEFAAALATEAAQGEQEFRPLTTVLDVRDDGTVVLIEYDRGHVHRRECVISFATVAAMAALVRERLSVMTPPELPPGSELERAEPTRVDTPAARRSDIPATGDVRVPTADDFADWEPAHADKPPGIDPALVADVAPPSEPSEPKR